jgi:hypothetical protein
MTSPGHHHLVPQPSSNYVALKFGQQIQERKSIQKRLWITFKFQISNHYEKRKTLTFLRKDANNLDLHDDDDDDSACNYDSDSNDNVAPF